VRALATVACVAFAVCVGVANAGQPAPGSSESRCAPVAAGPALPDGASANLSAMERGSESYITWAMVVQRSLQCRRAEHASVDAQMRERLASEYNSIVAQAQAYLAAWEGEIREYNDVHVAEAVDASTSQEGKAILYAVRDQSQCPRPAGEAPNEDDDHTITIRAPYVTCITYREAVRECNMVHSAQMQENIDMMGQQDAQYVAARRLPEETRVFCAQVRQANALDRLSQPLR
jgi:hypothetical protein